MCTLLFRKCLCDRSSLSIARCKKRPARPWDFGAPGECGHEQCLNTKFKLCSNSVQTLFIVCSNNVQIQTLFIHCSNSLPKIQTLFIVYSGPRPLKMLYSYFIQTLFILRNLKFILSSNSFEKFKLCSNFIQNSNFVQTLSVQCATHSMV